MKMQNCLFISLILFAAMQISCKGKTASQEEEVQIEERIKIPSVITLTDVHNKKGEEVLSTLAGEIKYIPLETKSQSLLKNITKVTILANGNMVVSDNDRIYLFSPEGKYIRAVSQNGSGPADYTRISAIASHPDIKRFYVQTTAKVIEFDEEGDFLNQFATESRPMDMVVEPDGYILLHQMSVLKAPEDTATTWSVYRYNTVGEEIRRFADGSPRIREEGVMSFIMPSRPLYLHNDEVRFNEFGNDTIFTIGEKELIPYTTIDLGDMKMSATPKGINPDVIFEELNNKLNLAYLTEDDVYMYMVFGWGFSGKYLYSTYNKTNGKIVNYGEGGIQDTNYGLTNDVDGGLPYYPYIIDPNGTRIMWKNASDFKDEILKKDYETMKSIHGEKFDNVWQIAKSLKDDDNPVLILIP